ncbi:hypothetical protein RF11_14165 [Thelohanellus kitauei]|uniref:Integrase catalytic domain-containing protein n=1 Tax=Thelohanellus kitauei TaxID=669202 RepID=A0A0C2MC00_THEKT|nr:hypothetical protein RF11_14165 [Thelohanellus kitauei]
MARSMTLRIGYIRGGDAVVIQAIKDISSRFGIRLRIHSGQGSQFTSGDTIKNCNEMGIEKSQATAKHAEGNGLAERNVQVLKQKQQKICQTSDDWDQQIPLHYSGSGCRVAHRLRQLQLKLFMAESFDVYRIPGLASKILPSICYDYRGFTVGRESNHLGKLDMAGHNSKDTMIRKRKTYLGQKHSTKGLELPSYGQFQVMQMHYPTYLIRSIDNSDRKFRIHHNRTKLYEKVKIPEYSNENIIEKENSTLPSTTPLRRSASTRRIP